jgi:hypothetical protein
LDNIEKDDPIFFQPYNIPIRINGIIITIKAVGRLTNNIKLVPNPAPVIDIQVNIKNAITVRKPRK